MKIYQKLAQTIAWQPTPDFIQERENRLAKLMDNAPSGSGIDCGTKLDEKSSGEKIILNVEYHHMNDGGYYDGWTNHQVIVTPSLQFDFRINITGINRNDIKDYLLDVYQTWLNNDIS